MRHRISGLRDMRGIELMRKATGVGKPAGRNRCRDRRGLCRAITRTLALSWSFRCSSGRSPILADQALDDVGALDPGGHIDRLTGLVQRGPLVPRLVRPMTVVMPGVLGQDPAKVPFTLDQQMVEALAPERSHIPF